MDVSEKQIKRIASLSKLNLEGGELKELTQDFNQILRFVDKISEVDTQDIDLGGESSVYYKKSEKKPPSISHLSIRETSEIAPQFKAGYFVVPRVIDNNG